MSKIEKKEKLCLDDPVSVIKGIGPKKAESMKECGLEIIFDLLRIYPTKYQDRRTATNISDLEKDTQALIKVRLESIKSIFARKGLAIVTADFSDISGKITIKWFNKTYLTKQSSCCGNKLNLGKYGRLAQNIYITLHKLTISTSLRTIGTPHVTHL